MARLTRSFLFCCIAFLLCVYCTSSVNPVPTLSSPVITSVELTISSDFREAAHINWSPPHHDETSRIKSYTLLRMVEGDTFFSVHSQNIPADTLNFYDPLESSLFSSSSAEVKSVYYRIFPIDEFERWGDTSDICTLWLLQQPALQKIDTVKTCLSWTSDIHLGGLHSYCKIWKDSLSNSFSGSKQTAFPPTDKPAVFTTCFPEKLFTAGRWYYALFLESADAHSLSIGFIDVP